MENQKDSFESMAVDYISQNSARSREYGLVYQAMKHAVKWQLEQTRSFVDQLASANDVSAPLVLDQNTKTLEKSNKEKARDFLLEILNNPFEVNVKENTITYYQNNEFIFEQDIKNGYLWIRYTKIWSVLANQFKLSFEEIRDLCKKVVCKALNCKELTPTVFIISFSI